MAAKTAKKVIKRRRERKNVEKGHAISVHPDTSVLQLVLKKFGRNIEPHFIIAAKDSSDAEEYDGAKKYEANKLYFSLLSDSFVLSDNVIYPIAESQPNISPRLDQLFSWGANNNLRDAIRNTLQELNTNGTVIYTYFVKTL